MEKQSYAPYVNNEEIQYLDIIRKIIEKGAPKIDRTGTGTRAIFGEMMKFSLKEVSFPLLTTKKVFFRGIAEELLFFIKGDTNTNHLSEKGVKIWDAHSSKEFLTKRGFPNREQGDIGPSYGFQWRHFGAKYTDMNADYTGQGVDQLAECIHLIKTDPTSRRIILTAWNPIDLPMMALPACHSLCQFFVNEGELSCMMYQRSCDMGLGVPFNIASYSLLTCLIAHSCGLKPGEFIHSMGDTHVYENHISPLQVQLSREPKPFPKLVIKCEPMSKTIFEYTIDDFEIVGYNHHPVIFMEMAV
jgi:thymidylate synthase